MRGKPKFRVGWVVCVGEEYGRIIDKYGWGDEWSYELDGFKGWWGEDLLRKLTRKERGDV